MKTPQKTNRRRTDCCPNPFPQDDFRDCKIVRANSRRCVAMPSRPFKIQKTSRHGKFHKSHRKDSQIRLGVNSSCTTRRRANDGNEHQINGALHCVDEKPRPTGSNRSSGDENNVLHVEPVPGILLHPMCSLRQGGRPSESVSKLKVRVIVYVYIYCIYENERAGAGQDTPTLEVGVRVRKGCTGDVARATQGPETRARSTL